MMKKAGGKPRECDVMEAQRGKKGFQEGRGVVLC